MARKQKGESDDAGLDVARRKLAQLQGTDEGGGLRKWDTGMNAVRFLPLRGVPTEFYTEAAGHYIGGNWVRCLTTKWYGKAANNPGMETPCPACKQYLKEVNVVNKTTKRGTDEAKEKWKAVKEMWGPSFNYYCLQYNPEADEPVVEPARFGSQILQGLLTEYTRAGVRFFSVKNGRTMYINKAQKKGSRDLRNVEYSVVRGKSREDISEIWSQIKDDLPDLEEAIGPVLKPDEIKAIVDAFSIQMEEPSKKRRSRRDEEEDDDDDDDDEDSDDGDGEDSDDEEDSPPRRKVSSSKKGTKEKKGPTKPACFADPGVHDPDDDVCMECPFLKRCGAAIEEQGGGSSDEVRKLKRSLRSKE